MAEQDQAAELLELLSKVPIDKLPDGILKQLKQRLTDEENERKTKYMDAVTAANYIRSADKSVERLLQIYLIFTRGDKRGRIAPEKKMAELLEHYARLSPERFKEEAKLVPYVKQLRGGKQEVEQSEE